MVTKRGAFTKNLKDFYLSTERTQIHVIMFAQFAVRFEFNKKMKLVISFMARNDSTITVYRRLSDDVKQLILDYIPGN